MGEHRWDRAEGRGRWRDELLAVPMRRAYRLTEGPDVRGLRDHLALLGVQQLGGEGEVKQVVAEARKAGLVEDRQSSRLRKMVDDLARTEGLTEESDAARELREMVRRAAA